MPTIKVEDCCGIKDEQSEENHSVDYSFCQLKKPLLLHLFSNNKHLLVPLFAKALNKRVFKKFVCPDTLAAAFNECTAAHIPLMQVHSNIIAHLAQTHGIEITRNGFAPLHSPLAIGFVYEADTVAVFIARCKDAILAVHNGCDQVAVTVVINYALFLDNGTRLGGHLFCDYLICFFKFLHLFHEYRSAGITLDTTCTLAVCEVAAEIFLKKVE